MEIWKDIVGYEDYFMISNLGNIWGKRSNRKLKLQLANTGYYVISSRIGGRQGKSIIIRAHRAVAEAFLMNPNNLPCINHKNGNKLDNNVNNLEWCSYSQNTQHAYFNNLIDQTNNSWNAENRKLTNEQVKFIRENYIPYSRDFSFNSLAKMFDVDHHTIYDVYHRITYKDVE